ncbi:hypothetical protein [Corallococcus terminator]|uniref:hypothetical protein n=1 Tax=Corallococcus terminator TaxID=2316733 RepID=UPI0011C35081|nr:hypothetical protein [Corallococcus terminator]
MPLPERLFASLLVVSSFAPVCAGVYAQWVDPHGATVLGILGRHPVGLWLAVTVVILAALAVLEPPRRLDARGWLAQLRARSARAKATYDAGLRRLTEEQHRAVQSHEEEEQQQ